MNRMQRLRLRSGNMTSGHPVTEHLFLTPTCDFLNFLPRDNCLTNTCIMSFGTPKVKKNVEVSSVNPVILAALLLGKSTDRTLLQGWQNSDISSLSHPAAVWDEAKMLFKELAPPRAGEMCRFQGDVSSGTFYQSFLSRITADDPCHPSE